MAGNLASTLNMAVATKEQWESVRWEDIEKFIGPNADKYKNLWEKQRANMMTKGKLGWVPNFCWTALLLLGMPWAVARKQYGVAAMSTFVVILVNFLKLPVGAMGAVVFMMAMTVKNIYIQYVIAKIAEIDTTGVTGEARDAQLRGTGGLEISKGVIAGVALAVVVLLLAMIF